MPVILPAWPEGTVGLLATTAPEPFVVPVSTCLRARPDAVIFGLARTRGSLARLRERPRVALALLAGGGVACTAHGHAEVVAEHVDGADGVAAVWLAVDAIADHMRPTFAIDAGVGWHWLDAAAAQRDAGLRAALRALADQRV